LWHAYDINKLFKGTPSPFSNSKKKIVMMPPDPELIKRQSYVCTKPCTAALFHEHCP